MVRRMSCAITGSRKIPRKESNLGKTRIMTRGGAMESIPKNI